MPTPSSTTITVKSSELREGDVVLGPGGLRCLLDGPVQTFSHGRGHLVYAQRALVLNRDDVNPDHVPLAYTAPRDGETDHRWTIQGNDFVKWCVERDVHSCVDNAVMYESDGALGHGWECGICGTFLQAG